MRRRCFVKHARLDDISVLLEQEKRLMKFIPNGNVLPRHFTKKKTLIRTDRSTYFFHEFTKQSCLVPSPVSCFLCSPGENSKPRGPDRQARAPDRKTTERGQEESLTGREGHAYTTRCCNGARPCRWSKWQEASPRKCGVIHEHTRRVEAFQHTLYNPGGYHFTAFTKTSVAVLVVGVGIVC